MGMAGCMATCVVQPADMVKVRIQIGGAEGGSTNPIEVAKTVFKNEGPLGFYNGISAAFARQIVYTGSRLALYDLFTEQLRAPDGTLSFPKITISALAAGGIGATVANPTDLSLVRMQ